MSARDASRAFDHAVDELDERVPIGQPGQLVMRREVLLRGHVSPLFGDRAPQPDAEDDDGQDAGDKDRERRRRLGQPFVAQCGFGHAGRDAQRQLRRDGVAKDRRSAVDGADRRKASAAVGEYHLPHVERHRLAVRLKLVLRDHLAKEPLALRREQGDETARQHPQARRGPEQALGRDEGEQACRAVALARQRHDDRQVPLVASLQSQQRPETDRVGRVGLDRGDIDLRQPACRQRRRRLAVRSDHQQAPGCLQAEILGQRVEASGLAQGLKLDVTGRRRRQRIQVVADALQAVDRLVQQRRDGGLHRERDVLLIPMRGGPDVVALLEDQVERRSCQKRHRQSQYQRSAAKTCGRPCVVELRQAAVGGHRRIIGRWECPQIESHARSAVCRLSEGLQSCCHGRHGLLRVRAEGASRIRSAADPSPRPLTNTLPALVFVSMQVSGPVGMTPLEKQAASPPLAATRPGAMRAPPSTRAR